VLFGWLAVRITHAVKPIQFMQRSGLFLLAGLLWSVLDLTRAHLTCENLQKPYWALWIPLDLAQLVVTLIIVWWYGSNIGAAYTIAAIFILFLFLDIKGTVRASHLPYP
jgi:hypothetical protein